MSSYDVIDEVVTSVSNLTREHEHLESALPTYDESNVHGYDEMVATLTGLEVHARNLIKFDIDL